MSDPEQPQKKVSAYLLSAALIGSLGLNVAQSDLVGEARAGIVEDRPFEHTEVLEISQVTGGTVLQAAQRATAGLNMQHELSGANAFSISDVLQVHVFFDDVSNQGKAVLRVRLKKPVTVMIGEPE